MAEMSAGRAVIELLKAEQVPHLFGIVGVTFLDVLDVLYDDKSVDRVVVKSVIYAFDPNVQVSLEEFTDIAGRNFRQPEEGLGFDASPSAHMWRAIIWPTKYL